MSKISQESIEQVATATDIIDLIGSYFPLKRVGTNFRALCPFHNEKSPSFYVNPTRQTFHCFGCGAGGGVFRFVMDYEHLDFPTAVRRLAERAGVALIEESSSHDIIRRNERGRLLDLHRKAALWYHHQLLRSTAAAPAREYLKKRGLSKEIAIAWQIGYAPNGWNVLKKWGIAEGFHNSELVAAGLVLQRDSQETYDRFRHRLMFPIRNDYGDVIGFSGRILTAETSEAKYVNSPETSLFSKGKILFGIDKSKRALVQAGEAIVMEGQIDLIAAFEHGCQNVVAPQGTAFTSEQARLLRRFVDRVILCFDSDAAGKNAAERSLPALLAHGFDVRVAALPSGEDPDSLIQKQGIEAFQQIVAGAENFFDYTITRFQREVEAPLPPHRVAALAKQLGGYLNLLPDAVLRETTSSQVALRLGISTSALQTVASSVPVPSGTLVESSTLVTSAKISAGTELLCRLALVHPEVRSWLCEQKSPMPHELDAELALLEELLSLDFSSAQPVGVLLPSLSLPLQQFVSSWDLEKTTSDPLCTAKDLWLGFQVAAWKRRQVEITAQLKKTGISTDQILLLQQELLDLQHAIGEVSGPR
ncbi:MAG: DNA primase [Chthoniobacterales bacterium]